MANEVQTITVKVRRADPDVNGGEASYQSYTVPLEPGSTVLSVLRHITENIDRTLSHLPVVQDRQVRRVQDGRQRQDQTGIRLRLRATSRSIRSRISSHQGPGCRPQC